MYCIVKSVKKKIQTNKCQKILRRNFYYNIHIYCRVQDSHEHLQANKGYEKSAIHHVNNLLDNNARIILLWEKCREPPVLDTILSLIPLPHETVCELSQNNVNLQNNTQNYLTFSL
jgi:hypothetical protein